MLTLYQFPISHYCEKARWALEYKNIEYKKVNLLPGLHAKKARNLCSSSSLPILVHNNKAINESSEIISYLDHMFPMNSLTPTDPHLKQETLKWEKFADEMIGPDVRCICYHTLLDHPDIIIPYFTNEGPWYGKLYMNVTYPKLSQKMKNLMKLDDAEVEASQNRLSQTIQTIIAHIHGRSFFVGDAFSRADLAVASLLAPLCKTKKYGIEWPEEYPEPLASTVSEYNNSLDWVHRIYKQFR